WWSSSSVWDRSDPTSTLRKNRKLRRLAILSNSRVTRLVLWWSGATPARTSPYGIGSRSKTLTRTPCWVSSSSAAYMAAGPEPTIATVSGPPARGWTYGASSTGASFDVGGGLASRFG